MSDKNASHTIQQFNYAARISRTKARSEDPPLQAPAAERSGHTTAKAAACGLESNARVAATLRRAEWLAQHPIRRRNKDRHDLKAK